MRPRLATKLDSSLFGIDCSCQLVILPNRLEILCVNRAEEIHDSLESITRKGLEISDSCVSLSDCDMGRLASIAKLGSRILELILDHSEIMLQLRDTVESPSRDTLDPLELAAEILYRLRVVFHVLRLQDCDCFVD